MHDIPRELQIFFEKYPNNGITKHQKKAKETE